MSTLATSSSFASWSAVIKPPLSSASFAMAQAQTHAPASAPVQSHAQAPSPFTPDSETDKHSPIPCAYPACSGKVRLGGIFCQTHIPVPLGPPKDRSRSGKSDNAPLLPPTKPATVTVPVLNRQPAVSNDKKMLLENDKDRPIMRRKTAAGDPFKPSRSASKQSTPSSLNEPPSAQPSPKATFPRPAVHSPPDSQRNSPTGEPASKRPRLAASVGGSPEVREETRGEARGEARPSGLETSKPDSGPAVGPAVGPRPVPGETQFIMQNGPFYRQPISSFLQRSSRAPDSEGKNGMKLVPLKTRTPVRKMAPQNTAPLIRPPPPPPQLPPVQLTQPTHYANGLSNGFANGLAHSGQAANSSFKDPRAVGKTFPQEPEFQNAQSIALPAQVETQKRLEQGTATSNPQVAHAVNSINERNLERERARSMAAFAEMQRKRRAAQGNPAGDRYASHDNSRLGGHDAQRTPSVWNHMEIAAIPTPFNGNGMTHTLPSQPLVARTASHNAARADPRVENHDARRTTFINSGMEMGSGAAQANGISTVRKVQPRQAVPALQEQPPKIYPIQIRGTQPKPPSPIKVVDETVFDRLIYSQAGASSPPRGVAIPEVAHQQKPTPSLDLPDEPLYADIDPRIHWPQPHSEAWYENKMAEISSRGGRKANYGKAAQRMRDQRLREAALPLDETLPEKILGNAAWVRALKRIKGIEDESRISPGTRPRGRPPNSRRQMSGGSGSALS
ncbi:hypothetical protein B0T19DRAFT_162867 [Cercophora scortea]|uniref:Uncharacterized protein n=1 Tax=Cercophora scortea TaxID=314031 RepID=A0AAE0IM27_9PEZI|nr:hypothetical protein B0T19DRAFT_162867 [Cercophora scortea]